MAGNRLTILFADPEAAWHEQAAAMLQPHGVQAVRARTGREALSRIESGDVHVAVLDQQLPQLSGLQVVKLTRKLQEAPPAILLRRTSTTSFFRKPWA
ncbi:MAG: response regulator [Tepidisphaeraceae bacterium]